MSESRPKMIALITTHVKMYEVKITKKTCSKIQMFYLHVKKSVL